MTKRLKTLLAAVLSVLIITLNCVTVSADTIEAEEGFVIGEGIRVRLGPGVNYEHLSINGVYQYYEDGEVLTILGSSVNSSGELWYNVKLNRDKEYITWVRDEYFQLIVNKERDPEFEAYLNEQGFPESYKPAIRRLHNL